jgi:hypothetical protein
MPRTRLPGVYNHDPGTATPRADIAARVGPTTPKTADPSVVASFDPTEARNITVGRFGRSDRRNSDRSRHHEDDAMDVSVRPISAALSGAGRPGCDAVRFYWALIFGFHRVRTMARAFSLAAVRFALVPGILKRRAGAARSPRGADPAP